jgi:hypothetical protein
MLYALLISLMTATRSVHLILLDSDLFSSKSKALCNISYRADTFYVEKLLAPRPTPKLEDYLVGYWQLFLLPLPCIYVKLLH